MAKWRQMILAGIAAAGLSLFVGVRAEAAPENDSYVPGQVYAAEKPRIVDGDPVIYLDGGDKISVEGRASNLFPIPLMTLEWQKLMIREVSSLFQLEKQKSTRQSPV